MIDPRCSYCGLGTWPNCSYCNYLETPYGQTVQVLCDYLLTIGVKLPKPPDSQSKVFEIWQSWAQVYVQELLLCHGDDRVREMAATAIKAQSAVDRMRTSPLVCKIFDDDDRSKIDLVTVMPNSSLVGLTVFTVEPHVMAVTGTLPDNIGTSWAIRTRDAGLPPIVQKRMRSCPIWAELTADAIDLSLSLSGMSSQNQGLIVASTTSRYASAIRDATTLTEWTSPSTPLDIGWSAFLASARMDRNPHFTGLSPRLSAADFLPTEWPGFDKLPQAVNTAHDRLRHHTGRDVLPEEDQLGIYGSSQLTPLYTVSFDRGGSVTRFYARNGPNPTCVVQAADTSGAGAGAGVDRQITVADRISRMHSVLYRPFRILDGGFDDLL